MEDQLSSDKTAPADGVDEALMLDAERYLREARERMELRLAKIRGEEADNSPFNAYWQSYSSSRARN